MIRVSASAVDRFLSCPLSYKYVYVDKNVEKHPGNIYIRHGSAIHKALEVNYRQKISSRVDLPIPEVIKAFQDELMSYVNKYPNMTVFPGKTNKDLAPGLLLDGEAMLVLYMNNVAKYIQPLYVEWEFTIPLKSIGIEIHGFVDLITEDGYIIDHKNCGVSTEEKWTQNFVDNSFQLTMYSLAYRKTFKVAEKGQWIDVLKRLKGGPKLNRIETTRTDLDVLSLIQLLNQMGEIIKQNLFYPNYKSCMGCEFREACNRLSNPIPIS